MTCHDRLIRRVVVMDAIKWKLSFLIDDSLGRFITSPDECNNLLSLVEGTAEHSCPLIHPCADFLFRSSPTKTHFANSYGDVLVDFTQCSRSSESRSYNLCQ